MKQSDQVSSKSKQMNMKDSDFKTKIGLDQYLEQQALKEYREFLKSKAEDKSSKQFEERQYCEDQKTIFDIDDQKNKIQGQMNQDEKWNGNVMIFYNDKTIFKGIFVNGVKESGIQHYLNGDVYEGNFENDKKNLKGVLKSNFKNTIKVQKYDGYFENGFKEYLGNLVTNKLTYRGQYKKGMRQGKGSYIFNNGISYWGQMHSDVKHGYGILMKNQLNMDNNLIIQKNLNTEIDQYKQVVEQEQQYLSEKNYEYFDGHFLFNKKHGIGRSIMKDGSYTYGFYQNGYLMGFVLHYHMNLNQWEVKLYQQKENQIGTFGQSIRLKKNGQPDSQYDGHFNVILDHLESLEEQNQLDDPDCNSFVDLDFDHNINKFILKDTDIESKEPSAFNTKKFKFKSIKKIDFYQHLNRQGEDLNDQVYLFQNPISPENVLFKEEQIDAQVLMFIKTLANYSQLVKDIFTFKYSIQQGYFLFKVYDQKQIKTQILDDRILVCKTNTQEKSKLELSGKESNRYSTRAKISVQQEQKDEWNGTYFGYRNTDLGWILLHKLICKYHSSYFIRNKANQDKISEYYYYLTGRPIQSFTLSNEDINAQDLKMFKQLYKFRDNEFKFAFLKLSQISNNNKNAPIQLIGYFECIDIQQNQTNHYILLKDFNDTNKNLIDQFNKFSVEYVQKEHKQLIQKSVGYFALNRRNLKEYFEKVIICMHPYDAYLNQNTFQIKDEQVDQLLETDFKKMLHFKITIDCEVLIYIQQILQTVEQYLPFRVILAKQMKLQKKDQIAQQDKQEYDIYDYTYVFGRGQIKDEKFMKSKFLTTGEYVLFIQIDQTGQLQTDQIFKVNIYAPILINIQVIQEIHNFQRKVYLFEIFQKKYQFKQLKDKMKQIQNLEMNEHENDVQIENYYETNLSNVNNGGDENLQIIQCFLKKEGTYLQYFINHSKDKKWSQSLYFNAKNMKVLNQSDNFKIDIHLYPKSDELLVLQQIKGEDYFFEGGEGTCDVSDYKMPTDQSQLYTNEDV